MTASGIDGVKTRGSLDGDGMDGLPCEPASVCRPRWHGQAVGRHATGHGDGVLVRPPVYTSVRMLEGLVMLPLFAIFRASQRSSTVDKSVPHVESVQGDRICCVRFPGVEKNDWHMPLKIAILNRACCSLCLNVLFSMLRRRAGGPFLQGGGKSVRVTAMRNKSRRERDVDLRVPCRTSLLASEVSWGLSSSRSHNKNNKPVWSLTT
jgi:hypothetical protein